MTGGRGQVRGDEQQGTAQEIHPVAEGEADGEDQKTDYAYQWMHGRLTTGSRPPRRGGT